MRQLGYDVDAVHEWDHDPGDEEILRQAQQSGRILVTIDKDLGQLAVYRGHAHCGIIRLVNLSARMHAPVCDQVVRKYRSDLENGAILTVDLGRVRIRKG